MVKFFVYKHINLINGKMYIGKSINPIGRWYRHIYDAKKNKNGKQLLFHKAIMKYGTDNFKMEILAEYESDKDALIGEMYYIGIFNSNNIKIGYNLTSGGYGVSGYKRTEKEKLAISKRNSGKGNGMYGKTQSIESRIERGKKISKTKANNSQIVKIIKPETIEKLKISVKEKSSQNLSDSQKDLIIEIYNTGKILKRDLAKQFFVEEKTIRYVIRYWECVKNNKLKYLKSEQKEEIIKLYEEKQYTKKQIAEITNIHFNRVEAVIKMYRNKLLKNKNA